MSGANAHDVLARIVHGNVTRTGLAEALGSSGKDVGMAVQRLKRRGLVVMLRPGEYAATEEGRRHVADGHQILSGSTSPKPRTRTRGLRQRAWWVMRVRKQVSVSFLLESLADGSERAAAANMRKYVLLLERAGYLKELPHQSDSPASDRLYHLVRDTGREAPVLRQRIGMLYDPNSGEVFYLNRGDA